LSEEVKIKNDQYDRLAKLEEERPVLNKELECIQKELSEKTAELHSQRTRLEEIIRSEQVTLFEIIVKCFNNNNNNDNNNNNEATAEHYV
jgi:hypothetical protein